jgi:hypothetical protein
MLEANKRKYSILNVLIVIFLLIYMDSPFFTMDKIGRLIFLILLIFIYFFKSKKNKLDKEFVLIIMITAALIGIQGYIWGFKLFTLFSFIGILLITPYLALKIVGVRFLSVFSNIIYVIAIYTSVLWIGQNLMPDFDQALQDFSVYMFPFGTDEWPRSIIFYTVSGFNGWGYMPELGLYRNAGVFHEPGAYAVFLDLAIAINLINTGKLYNKKNVILILVLISTFSTAGFFALFVIVLLYFLDIKRKVKPVYSTLITVIMASLFYILTSNITFLGEKVVNTYKEETSRNLDEKTTGGRIYSARKAIIVLTRYPLTGKGITSSVREDLSQEEDTGGYGFMSFFSRIGVILSLLFVIYFVKGTKKISAYFSGSKQYWHILFFSLAINLFSQKFIVDSVFMMIFFIGALSSYSYSNISPNQANVIIERK